MSWFSNAFITRLFRRPVASRISRRHTPRFRPSLLALEDRTVPAVNDMFANATVVSNESNQVTVAGDSFEATGEPGEPIHTNGDNQINTEINSVWWQWTAPADGLVTVDTRGSDFDTLLAAYTGETVDTLTLQAENNDIAPPEQFPDNPEVQSRIEFALVGGTVYYIAVDGSEALTGLITLNLSFEPANEPPQIGNQSFAVDENSAAGTVVGTVLATDPDAGQILTYSITEGNSFGAFAINAATGEITVVNTAALNFEVTPSFTLTVEVIDSGTPSLTASAIVTVNLNDLSEVPVFVSTGPFAVDENGAAGTVVGMVTATGPDAGQTLTYAITSGNASGAFAIDPDTGEITVANTAALNFEVTSSFTLTVRATQSGPPGESATATVTVNLNDVNEAPVFVSTGPIAVDENSAAGTTVGTVLAVDPDAGQTVTYSITSGNTSGAFAINATTGEVTVANASVLNYEVTPSFTLTVEVTDSVTPSHTASATVTVNLNDVNETPVFVNTGPFAVDENGAIGATVGTVGVTDPDAGQTLTYAITGGNASGAFTINAATGEITVANASVLNYEVAPSFTLTVLVTDDGTPSLTASATVVVNLRDINDAPVLDNSGTMNLATINQGDAANSGTLVSDLLASGGSNRITDEDVGALSGIAVVGADTSHGSWQFSTDGGATWSALGAVSNSSARLLAANANTRVRFVPAAGFGGTVTAGLTFCAWDRTSGSNGGIDNASVGGGSSAFSTATETAGIDVRSVEEQFQLLEAEVQSLVAAGVLNSSQGNNLEGKLSNARRKYEQGNIDGAVNQMGGFIHQVEGYVSNGILTPAQGQSLIAMANALIASIES